MAKGEIRLNQTLKIIGTIKDQDGDVADVSEASTKDLIFEKPSGGKLVKNDVSFNSDGKDGKLTYTTLTTDLDELKVWEYQFKVVVGGGTYYSDIGSFEVRRNL